MRNHKMPSIADQIFSELEHDILTGVYEKDELLTEVRLSEELGVSRTPVREALGRLSQEHIVETTTKGARVVGISETDLEDIYDIRLRIEGMASRRAAENATKGQLDEMRRLLDLQEFYTLKSDKEGINETDSEFHTCLYRSSGSPILENTLESLHRRIVKYRRVSVETAERARASFREHEEIYRAIAAHDPDQAEKLTIEHILKARKSILGR